MMRYPNLFAELGVSEAAIDARIEAAFRAIFEDTDERFYFEPDDAHGYLLDTSGGDADMVSRRLGSKFKK